MAAVAVLLAMAAPAQALTLTGLPEVIDSDILQLEGYTVYLVGVESIEADQTCNIDGQEWDCYPAAVRALQTLTGQGEVSCEVLSGPNFLDQLIARCIIGDDDIGEQFVRAGFGLAIAGETREYDEAESAAREAKTGLWQGTFMPPADWRRTKPFKADRPGYRPASPAP